MYPYNEYDNEEIFDINSFNIKEKGIDYSPDISLTYDETNNYPFFFENFSKKIINEPEIEVEELRKRVSLFNVEKQDKHRGRKRKEKSPSKRNYGPFTHSKFTSDNLIRKIQVHFMNFILDYANTILKKYGYWKKGDFFVKISYDFKKNINKDNINLLKKSNIEYVLCQNISSKFKTIGNDKNINIFKKVKENYIIKYFLSENYLQLFKDVYYKNKRIIKFKIGDYSDIIDLTNTKMFEDLLKKKINQSEDYREKLKQSVKIYYFKQD